MAAPVPFTWTGCHIGGHVGGVVSDDTTTNAETRSASVQPASSAADRSAATISSRPTGSWVAKAGRPGPA
jgi:hypothetical protein